MCYLHRSTKEERASPNCSLMVGTCVNVSHLLKGIRREGADAAIISILKMGTLSLAVSKVTQLASNGTKIHMPSCLKSVKLNEVTEGSNRGR
jgi:hypothetical protein